MATNQRASRGAVRSALVASLPHPAAVLLTLGLGVWIPTELRRALDEASVGFVAASTAPATVASTVVSVTEGEGP